MIRLWLSFGYQKGQAIIMGYDDGYGFPFFF